ncbi:MbnP family protein [Spirosoma gilvum]
MKVTVTTSLLVVFAIGIAVLACDTKDTDTSFDPVNTGKLRIAFDNVVGSSDLKLGSATYQNSSGESFTITKFNYFISNIKLRKADGSDYVVPQDSSYFLVQEEKPASQTITLSKIPAGSYTGLTFMVGVDSTRSLENISLRTGVLDPALNDGMYWDWNSGYIFLKIEGTSPVAPAAQNNAFFYHIGGFGGGYNGKKTLNNLRTVTLAFTDKAANVQTGSTPSVRIITDAMKIFNGPTQLSIAQHPSVMFDDYSPNIANNYAQMFSYDRILVNP